MLGVSCWAFHLRRAVLLLSSYVTSSHRAGCCNSANSRGGCPKRRSYARMSKEKTVGTPIKDRPRQEEERRIAVQRRHQDERPSYMICAYDVTSYVLPTTDDGSKMRDK